MFKSVYEYSIVHATVMLAYVASFQLLGQTDAVDSWNLTFSSVFTSKETYCFLPG